MYHPIDVKVGKRVRETRVARGLSQSALAEQLGVSFQQVQKYERGSNRMGASRLADVAKILGVSIGYLFEVEDQGDDGRAGGFIPRAVIKRAREFEAIPDEELKAALCRLVSEFARVSAKSRPVRRNTPTMKETSHAAE